MGNCSCKAAADKSTITTNDTTGIEKKSFTYHNGKKKVPKDANHIILHPSCSSINACSFRYCPSIRSIEVPKNIPLIEIENNAMNECKNLEKFDLPPSVQKIGVRAFYKCESLRHLHINNAPSQRPSLLSSPSSSLSSLSSALSSIGDEAFLDCKSLTSIELPHSLKFIGKYAFYGCTSLTSVTIHPHSNIETIQPSTFCNCTSLTTIILPPSIKYIQRSAFRHCESLTSIQIPKSVISIESDAFSECTSLTIMKIPSSVTEFKLDVFQRCSSLLYVDIHPFTIIQMEDHIPLYAFQSCSSLLSINIPSHIQSIMMYAFKDCTSLISVHISSSSSSASSSFSSSSSPSPSLTSIGDGAFQGCISLSSIIIPSSVSIRGIGTNAFLGCRTLQELFFCSSFHDPDNINTNDDFIRFLKHRYRNLPLHQACYHYNNGADTTTTTTTTTATNNNKVSLEQIRTTISSHQNKFGIIDTTDIIISKDTFQISPIHVLACNPNSTMEDMKNVLQSFHPTQQSLLLKEMYTLKNIPDKNNNNNNDRNNNNNITNNYIGTTSANNEDDDERVMSFTPLQLYFKCRGISYMSLIDALKEGISWILLESLFEFQPSLAIEIESTYEEDVDDDDDDDGGGGMTQRLYPFMIAAIQSNCDLEITYNLALSSVGLLAGLS